MRTVDPIKHEERRRDILDAAGRCFARDGFRGASISDICREAAISPGHLYHYFDSKEAIVRAMTEATLAAVDAVFELVSQSDDLITTFVSSVEQGWLKQSDVTHSLVFDMLAEAGHDPAVAKIVRDHNRALRSRLAALLARGQQDGQVDRGLDTDLAAAVLISAIDGAKSMTIRDPKLSKAGAGEHLKMLITRFLNPTEQ